MRVADIIGELKTFYKDGVQYRALDRHLTELDVERGPPFPAGPDLNSLTRLPRAWHSASTVRNYLSSFATP